MPNLAEAHGMQRNGPATSWNAADFSPVRADDTNRSRNVLAIGQPWARSLNANIWEGTPNLSDASLELLNAKQWLFRERILVMNLAKTDRPEGS